VLKALKLQWHSAPDAGTFNAVNTSFSAA